MKIVDAKNVTKSFPSGDGELVVLKDMSFSVEKGEFVSITGRSGSGKSTLMYQLGLLDHPNSGTIFVDGREVTTLSAEVRSDIRLSELGYVFQDYALIPELSALENVLLPLLMQGYGKEESYTKAKKSLDRIGLGERLGNLPNQLSGGEQQRVSIARATAHEPKIIFADEPTANLDSETSAVVLESFLELHREGQTIVMVTHEPEYAALTDRVVTLSDGKIISDILNKKR